MSPRDVHLEKTRRQPRWIYVGMGQQELLAAKSVSGMRCLLFVRAITGAWNHIPNPTHQRVPPSQSHGCHAPHRFSFPSIREQHDTNTILVHAADCGTNLDSWARRFMSKICTKLDPVDLEPRLTPTKLCLSLGGSCDRSINHQETG